MTAAEPARAASPAGQAHPLTEAQSGLWYMQRIDPANPILNTGQYIAISGPLDVAAFLAAVETTIAEADCLRLTFLDTPDGPRQTVTPAAQPISDYLDLNGAEDPRAQALADMARDTARPVDPERGPAALFRLYKVGPRDFLWYERIHHLAIDGYGMVLLTNRVAELYNERVAGEAARPPLAPLARAFEEDAAYRSSAQREKDRAFWHETLSGMAEPAGLKPGRAVTAYDFHRETGFLPPALTARLNAFATRHNLTWPDVLTGIAAAYCRRFAGTQDITVGVPFMGRLGSVTARAPCMVMNVLPLRLHIDEDAPLAETLAGLSRDMLRARRHGRYRSEQLRRELGLIGGQRRLYGPMINVQPFDNPPRFAGLDASLHILGAGAVDDITFTFRGDARSGLPFEVDANPTLYSKAETRGHADRLAAFLDAVLTGESLAAAPLATPAEARHFTQTVNATDHPVPQTTLTALIEAAFGRHAGACALRFGGDSVSYAELDAKSAALAAHLTRLGAGPDRLVAIALPRSVALLVALVGVLRAGGAYLPLDTAHPRERLSRILASAKPVCVLTDAETDPLFTGLAETLPVRDWPDTTQGDIPSSGPSGHRLSAGEKGMEPTTTLPTAARSDDTQDAAPRPPSPPGEEGCGGGIRGMPQALSPAHLAYVIYTSGSTGEPKGVAIEHRSIVNRLEWMRRHYGIEAGDRILQKTPATFDVSVWEFFLPLISGATLVIAPPGAHRDPDTIAALIRDERVTALHFVPSMLSAFLAAPSSAGLSVARVFCSGEELGADLRDRFHARIDGELHNLYGPTEAAVDVSYWPASREDRSAPVPIGFPVWNTRLYVLDAAMRPVPAGVVGDLYLGGVQLARCYLNRDDLTRERFLPDPFRPGESLYRTGDVARWRADGAVEFLGRSDHQVKIRGLRIELGEIEAAILASGLVREGVVVAREDRPGDRRLVAYAVPNPTYTEETLRRAVAALVPDYMVPAHIVTLDALPVTANGKLDRAALPAPAETARPVAALATDTERRLAMIFREVLGVEGEIGGDSDFFLCGGDSLLAVHLALHVRETFGRELGLGAVFEHPTLGGLAALIDAGADAADGGLGPVIRLATSSSARPPLFLIHPAGGIAWGYQHLARALSPARTVYGLQSPALDPAQPLPESLDSMARLYAERIEALYPAGIVHLAGWSVGGILAQALAVALKARGRRVGLAALLDAYPCECWRAEPEPDETAALKALLTIGGHDPAAYPDLVTRPAIVDFLRSHDGPLGLLPEAALDGVVRAVLDTNRLVRQHDHARYDGTLTHIRAGLDHRDRPLHPGLWVDHAAALDCAEVPFLHAQMASQTAAGVIAPLLAERMGRFELKG